MADFVCVCMILHDFFAQIVHQCSRLVGRWVMIQKSPNGSRVPIGQQQEAYILNLSPWRNLIFGCANPNSVDPERIKMILNMLSPGEES